MKAETLSTLQRLTTLVIIMALASCAPAPAPTFTPLPPTAPPTQTATATPPPTLTPTETQIPNPWIDLLAGRGEYVVPSNPIELGVETAKDLKINPKASPKAVYDEIVGSLVKQLELPENKYIWDQMVLEHPEWAGAPAAINSTNATDYSQMRKEMMQRFLQLSKGLVYVKLWPSNEVKVTDFAKPVVFECDEVVLIPSSGIRQISEYQAYGTIISPEGGLVIRTEYTPSFKQMKTSGHGKFDWPFEFYCSFSLLLASESQARGKDIGSAYMNSKQVYVDFRAFALDLREAIDLINVDAWHEGFLKSK